MVNGAATVGEVVSDSKGVYLISGPWVPRNYTIAINNNPAVVGSYKAIKEVWCMAEHVDRGSSCFDNVTSKPFKLLLSFRHTVQVSSAASITTL